MSETLYTQVLADIISVANKLKVAPSRLTQDEYFKRGRFKHTALKQLGGLHKIQADFWRDQRETDTLAVLRGQQQRKKYIRELENTVGDREYFANAIKDELRALFAAHPIQLSRKPKVRVSKSGKLRENVAFISDTHFGLNIDSEEVPSNSYNWTIAARRMAKYAEQVATYKSEHRKNCPVLRVCLGGDLAQGVIHLSEAGTQLITHQLYGTQWMLTQMIDYWRQFYSKIIVECTPDNHLRLTHKGHDRAMAQKFDSYATLLHLGLQTAFRKATDVSFHIPKTPHTEFDVLGHRIFMTHGDTVLRSGWVSKNLQIARITNDVRALQASHTEKPISAVLLGHVHVPLNTTLDNGVELIINGTGSGTDPYAQSLGIFNNNPCQIIFEATEDYVVGDFRKVYLKDADAVADYEKIITPYTGAFTNPPEL